MTSVVFFQAEDGIRDLVRSRGLGDVYKRQHCIIKTESQATSLFGIYGFADEQEKNVFMDLVSVSGVGNNTAQLILSSFEPGDLIQAIGTGNIAALQKVKGIGNKTAQRIIIDLKDKILKSAGDVKFTAAVGNTLKDESLSALLLSLIHI